MAGMWKLEPSWLNSALGGINPSFIKIVSPLREIQKLNTAINKENTKNKTHKRENTKENSTETKHK
jgi:hypothetical protein